MPHMLLGEGPDQAGGAEIRASILARSLVQRGWPVSFAVYDYGQPDEMTTEDGIRIVRASGRKGGLPFLRLLTRTLPADIRAFQAADADIYVELGVTWRSGVLARQCQKKVRKYILWLASITNPYAGVRGRSSMGSYPARRLALRGLREADLVIAQTNEQKKLMWELHERECPVIPNVWSMTPSNGPKAEPPEVLWAANYDWCKRPEWVVEVARRLPHIAFRMAGGPGEGQHERFGNVQELAQALPNLTVLGFVPFSEIDQHYKKASAYLCTSTIEGFPNTFLQAWNHRTPVVSTYDPDDVLQANDIGIACRDVDELTAAVQRACSAEGHAMAARARYHLERVHSVDAVMGALEPLLLS